MAEMAVRAKKIQVKRERADRKTLRQRISAYMNEVISFYGRIASFPYAYRL